MNTNPARQVPPMAVEMMQAALEPSAPCAGDLPWAREPCPNHVSGADGLCEECRAALLELEQAADAHASEAREW